MCIEREGLECGMGTGKETRSSASSTKIGSGVGGRDAIDEVDLYECPDAAESTDNLEGAPRVPISTERCPFPEV